ncbi:MAG TPA: Ig-like domain-containing protein [Candidatus Angelobacter sp.]|nr:Ig-like domain-containing protein [Candidatus Angelobacter sp.]
MVTATFSVLNVNTQYTMHIDNAGVTSAVISINGREVFGPSDFNPSVATLDRSITLAASNTVSVELRSKPGTSLAISVIGVDNDPPSIAEFASPTPNAFGWNNTDVGVSFLCSDATSGIAICPASFVLNSEGLNQIAQGTAFDRAGNSTTSSIQISIDKTAPAITASQTPSPNSANWNNTPVTVNFSCTDNLSGVQSCNAPVTIATEGANQNVSGKAVDFAGNSASTQASVNIDLTPPSISIASPANGAAVSAAKLQLTGSVSDNLSGVAAVSCNGAPASVTSGSFSCNITLASGSNSIQVQAIDVAGNTASTQLSVTFNPIPVVPPTAIFITPTMASLLSGQTRTVKLVGDIGQLVTGAKWSISDSSVASITPSDPPQLTALTPGTTTLTASFSGLSASMTVNVFSGTALPVGTPIWSVDPTPGNTVMQMIRGNPVNPGDPDIFAIERPNTLRAFTADGQQLWTILLDLTAQPFASQAATVSTAAPFAATATTTRTLTTQAQAAPSVLDTSAPIDAADPMAQMALQFDPMRRFLQRHPEMAGKIPLSSSAAFATSALAPQAETASIIEEDFLDFSIPDNNGGIVNVITRLLIPSDFRTPPRLVGTLVRVDNTTQQPSWRYDSPGEIFDRIAIAPDNTVYIEEQIVGRCCSFATIGVLAFDGVTGQQKFNLPIPLGHSNVFCASCSNPDEAANLANGVSVGPLSVMPDGSVTLITATQNLDETVQFMSFPPPPGCRFAPELALAPDCEIAVSDHRKVQRFIIQPDGSSSTQLIHTFDFDATNCGGDCHDPGLNTDPRNIFFGFFFGLTPAEVIPDGNGGVLAAWTGGGAAEPELGAQASHVSHFDASGGGTDYTVPLFAWNIIPEDPFFSPIFLGAMMLGENNVVFGSNGSRIETFDQGSGNEQWSSLPGGSIFLLESKAKGGMNAYTTNGKTVNGLLSFDPLGALTFFPITTGISSLSYFDASTLLATTTSGQGQMVSGINSDLAPLVWPFPGGNGVSQLAPALPKLTISKILPLVDATTGARKSVPLVGIANGQQESVQITSTELASPASATTITIRLETDLGTSGSATFSDGTTEMTITPTAAFPSVIQIKGVETSSIADNISLIAKVGHIELLRQKFSVVSVTIALTTAGSIPDDNSAKTAYLATIATSPGIGTPDFKGLGAFATDNKFRCGVGVLFTGVVAPSNYRGTIVFKRTLLNGILFDGATGTVLNTLPNTDNPADDTTDDTGQDEDPQSGGSQGKVYDIDAPGPTNVFPSVTTRRLRINFSQFAVLDDRHNTVPVSSAVPWFASVSCKLDEANPQLIFLLNDIASDNQAGNGTTKLTVPLR